MGDSKNGAGTVLLLVVTVGLVGLAAWDQVGRHLPKHQDPAEVAESGPAELGDIVVADSAAAGLPVYMEPDSVGASSGSTRPRGGAAPDSAAAPAGMPPGEVLTI